MMEFLYFPDDKSEYIPAVIELVIFMALAGLAMYFIYKYSKKKERQVDKQYAHYVQDNQTNDDKK